MSSLKRILKYVWPQMRKYSFAFYSIFILFGIRVFLDGIIRPIYFKKIIDSLSVSGLEKVIQRQEILKLVFIIILLSFLVLIVSRVCKFILALFEINVIKGLRNFSFLNIQNKSYNFFINNFSGSLVTKNKRFISSFETMFDIFVYDFYSTSILLIGIFISLSLQSKKIALIFFIFIIFYFSIIFIFLKKKMEYDNIEASADSKISGFLADVFGNIFAVKIFSAERKEIEKFNNIVVDTSIKMKKAWFFGLKIEVIQHILVFIVNSFVLYFLILLWLKESISTGTVVLVQTYMVIIFDKLWNLNHSIMRFMKGVADMKEIIDIFEIKNDVVDLQKFEKFTNNKKDILFKDVCFKYKNGQSVFDNFNLKINDGERVGLVGHSGAGKSTFINILLRFSDVNSGQILIDGQDIRNIRQDDLRGAISYVPQESVLFHRTIAENIAYGKNGATKEEIVEASKRAYAHEFIEKLPNGYDTLVGERGVKLSGGERQRIAIARAILKNAPILILDEATSSLDSISEKYIQNAFDEVMKGKTTIVIAHRLSTIQKMDRIIVLDEGKIIEEGTHAELLEKGGQYTDLWNHQAGGFIK